MEKKKNKVSGKRLLLLCLALAVLGVLGLGVFLRPAAPQEIQAAETAENAEDEGLAVVIPEETPAPGAIPHYDPSMRGDEGWVTADGKLFYLEGGGAVTGLRLIDGKYCYFDRNGVKAARLGVDVSTYNEAIDWERVRGQGISFAILRTGGRGWTSGSIYGDVRFERYFRDAGAAGMQLGVYFYSTALNEKEAADEAHAVLAALRGRSLALPVYYDVEISGEFPKGRADGLLPGARTRNALAFCRVIESAGYRAGVYAGQYFYLDSINYQPLSRYGIWMASYTNDGLPPRSARPYQIWQFTDRGNVDGISGGVDLNVMFTDCCEAP